MRGAEGDLPQVSTKTYRRNRKAAAAAERAQKQTQRALNAHAKLLYAQHAVTAPAATPQKDLARLGFLGASEVANARQRYQANLRALHEPKLQAAGPVKPRPLPKGFTGFTPAQEQQARRAGATRPRLGALEAAAGAARATPPTAAALSLPLAQYLRDIPVALAHGGKRTPRQQQAGLFYTGLGEEIGKSFARDVTDPAGHKLNLLLDLLALGSGGVNLAARGAAGARAARAGEAIRPALRARPIPERVLPKRLLPDESGLRKLRAEGGEIQVPLQSRNVLTAGAQHAFDRLSELTPGLPALGAKARIARRVPELQATRQLRMTEKAIPLAAAAKKLRGFRGTTPAEAAYTVVARYGHTGDEGVRLLETEIARRRKLIPALTGKPLKLQQTRVALLEAAKPLVRNPTPELEAALRLGRQAAEATTQMRLTREQKPLSQAAAEQAAAHHIRLLHGAEYVTPTAAREGVVSPALERQRGEVERLQTLYDRSEVRDATARGIGSRMQGDLLPVHLGGRGQSPLTQRLGGALSVQKDKLARMEAAAARRVRPTGLVGAEDVKPGPHGFYTSDRQERSTLAQLFQRRKSINIPREKIHARTGASFTAAREQLGPTVTLKDYLRETRLKGQQADADLALSFSRPFDAEADAAAVASGELRLLNPQAKTIPRAEIADLPEVELEALTPAQVAERLLGERTEWARNVFPATAESVSGEHRLGLRVVDSKIADAIQGLTQYQGQFAHRFLRMVDGLNNLERFLLIYANPAYGPVQRLGNLAFLGLLEGLEFPAAMVQNTRLIRQLPEDLQQWVDMEVGGGAARALAHEPGRSAGVTPVRAVSEKLTDVQQLIADQGPRRQAWVYEAGKEGFDTPEKIARLRDSPELEPTLNVISERAQQAMVKFRRTPTPLRRALSKVIFILPWLEGSTRYTGRLILDRPLTARAASELRDQIKEHQNTALKGASNAVRGFIPITGLTGVNPQGLSPTSTPADLAAIAKGLVTGKDISQGLNLGSLLQPTLTAGIESALRYNTYGGYQYPSDVSRADILRENLVGTVAQPVSGVGATLATLFRKPGPLTGPPAQQPAYVPEAGPGQALQRLLLGSARPRTVNLPAAQAKARELRRSNMDAGQRAQDDGRKMIGDLTAQARRAGVISETQSLPPVVKQAVRLRTQRYTNYAKAGASTQQEKLLADVKDLIARGKMPAQNLSLTNKFLASNPGDRAVAYQRELLGREFYGTDVLAQTRSEINAAGERSRG